jgi:hypothetical protein
VYSSLERTTHGGLCIWPSRCICVSMLASRSLMQSGTSQTHRLKGFFSPRFPFRNSSSSTHIHTYTDTHTDALALTQIMLSFCPPTQVSRGA